jgi:hypothetical protein
MHGYCMQIIFVCLILHGQVMIFIEVNRTFAVWNGSCQCQETGACVQCCCNCVFTVMLRMNACKSIQLRQNTVCVCGPFRNMFKREISSPVPSKLNGFYERLQSQWR